MLKEKESMDMKIFPPYRIYYFVGYWYYLAICIVPVDSPSNS